MWVSTLYPSIFRASVPAAKVYRIDQFYVTAVVGGRISDWSSVELRANWLASLWSQHVLGDIKTCHNLNLSFIHVYLVYCVCCLGLILLQNMSNIFTPKIVRIISGISLFFKSLRFYKRYIRQSSFFCNISYYFISHAIFIISNKLSPINE